MPRYVNVIHMMPETDEGLEVVAIVEVPDAIDDVYNALEYAFRWTQNLEGSWSRDDLPNNPDRNPNVIVKGNLPVHNGKTYGMRSTSVGDLMVLNGGPDTYKVARFGFEKVER